MSIRTEYIAELRYIMLKLGISDIDTILSTADEAARKGSSVELDKLQAAWYDSLASGSPDYSIYNSDMYIAEAFFCWYKYSRIYIKRLSGWSNVFDGKVILDVGNGIGFSSRQLAETFPNSKVIGTNIPGSVQYKISQSIGIDTRPLSDVGEVDIIFASEYFEHHSAPGDHLVELLRTKPKYIICANTFGSPSTGHFPGYKINNKDDVCGAVTSRQFNLAMMCNGYQFEHTGFWNNRPTVWTNTR